MNKITIEKCPCGMKGCYDYHLIGVGKFNQGSGFEKEEAQLIADLLNAPTITVDKKDAPIGAIHNGQVFIDRLESDYQFDCEAGPLSKCVDWQELKRCFEVLVDYAQTQTVPAEEPENLERTDCLLCKGSGMDPEPHHISYPVCCNKPHSNGECCGDPDQKWDQEPQPCRQCKGACVIYRTKEELF